jgi:hypothetical protein
VDLLRPARSRADIMQPLLALVQAIANYEVSTAVLDDHDWRINCDAQAWRGGTGLACLSWARSQAAAGEQKRSTVEGQVATQVAIIMMHPEYGRAAAALQPLQLGLGATFGMTRMAMSAQDFRSR